MSNDNIEKGAHGKRHVLGRLLAAIPHLERIAVVLLLLIIIAGAIGLIRKGRKNSVGIEQNKKIDITPTQIRSIEDIGQWEFLSIADEELVDTLHRGFFGDSELVRIYYGTVRMGIDMKDAKPGWIYMDKDTVVAQLPPVKLLDGNFIDEARTRSFYEKGEWSQADREALYNKARRIMLQRCVTPSNLRSAEQNASKQMDALLRAMGFEYVRVITTRASH